jgi:pilus assembly protein FimV
VEVTSVGRDEAGSLAVRLAPQSAFRQANLEFNPALAALRFNLEKRGDNAYVVRITSLQPINEPYLDLLLELTWSTGRVLREYTVLLDPPALRAAPELVAPVTPPAPAAPPVVAMPMPAAPTATATAPAAPAPAAEASRPAAVAAAPVAEGGTYTIKRGDTLSKIALETKPTNVSLEQMLVALFRANPNAFVGQNMNRMLAGRTLTIPSVADALAVSPSDARQEVAAQSADFAQYRSRLAQVAVAAAPATVAPPPAAAGQGRVTTRVEDKAAPAKAGDQLKIAKVEPSTAPGAAAGKAAQDEAIAKQRALKEQEERAAELKKANEQLKQALELQSKAGAAVQQQAEARKQEAQASAPAATAALSPEPAKAQAPAEPAKAAAPSEPAKAAPAAEPAKAEPAPKAEVAKAAPAKAPPAAAPAPEPSGAGWFDMLKDSTTVGLLALVVALFGGLIGLNVYRKRKLEQAEVGQGAGEGLRANSLFGQTGGQSVDTGATSTFNSSFIPAASQLDSNEVDPVAEADVYIAYGREEQAEEILKEALRVQPDRHAVRVKLLEIYSRRGDKASFNAVAEELRERTGGVGEEWERAVKLGRSLDPANAMFATATSEAALRGPTTELRLTPNTAAPRAPAEEPQPFEKTAPMPAEATLRMAPDSKLDTAMPLETKMSATDTSMPLDVPPVPPVTPAKPPSFAATLPLEEVPLPGKGAGTIDPFAGSAADKIDFAALDFDLGATTTTGAAAKATPAPAEPKREPAPAKAEAPQPAVDLTFPVTQPPKAAPAATATGRVAIPEVDLSLPPTPAPPQPPLEEVLSRPTLLGEVGALPDEQAPRLTSNTDQATVPLIDFDLTGSDVDLGGRRTETQAGSPLAAQMATKLDLARGYIDLGVKDGARELLEEVMRDGTREQRQQAVELLKQVEA